MRLSRYTHRFIESFPEPLEPGVLYVSIQFRTTAHLCFCGCGNEVYSPLSPSDWRMIFDGQSVSLSPSIGNWSFLCQSHYVLRGGHVSWAEKWTRQRIQRNRAASNDMRSRTLSQYQNQAAADESAKSEPNNARSGRIAKLIGAISRR